MHFPYNFNDVTIVYVQVHDFECYVNVVIDH